MSNDRFKDTVRKIASSPTKRSILGMAPKALTKEAKGATMMDNIFGQGGTSDVLKHIAQSTAATGLTASGALLTNQIYEHMVDNKDKLESQNREVGKLTANQQFKAQMINRLKPKYDDIYDKLTKDDVIQEADRDMIRSAYETMQRFAPNLAADENAAKSFLREHAIYGTGPSYASLKNLAEAEKAVAESGGMSDLLEGMPKSEG